MQYTPDYDTTIRTVVRTERLGTTHTQHIDWEHYPFDDPEHTACMCCDDAAKLKEIERLKKRLRTCEKFNERAVYASNYGGWPRIWHRVIGVGMASIWPYWKPRPVVIVDGTMGAEFYDWCSLTGATYQGEWDKTTQDE